MPILGERKQFCIQGHDTFIGGRFLSSRACKVCTGIRANQWKKNNPEKLYEVDRYAKIKLFYGLTRADYDRLLESQKGLCAICYKVNGNKALAVDHDHRTNKVRGLLCDKCNQGIGCFRDSKIFLSSAISYLEKNHAS